MYYILLFESACQSNRDTQLLSVACPVFHLTVINGRLMEHNHRKNKQSNLGSRMPQIMNNSVYEQIFQTQSVSDDVLCLELRTRKPSTAWSDKLGESTSNLGSRTPRIMNNSVYEQIFQTQSVSDDVLCLELRTCKLSTSWSDKLGESPFQTITFHFLTTFHLCRQLSSIQVQ